ncbi:unnamed protein product [Parajaminaea phylloscopi]
MTVAPSQMPAPTLGLWRLDTRPIRPPSPTRSRRTPPQSPIRSVRNVSANLAGFGATSQSKNDIFLTASPSLTPPPKVTPAAALAFATPEKKAMSSKDQISPAESHRSRNSLFFDSPASALSVAGPTPSTGTPTDKATGDAHRSPESAWSNHSSVTDKSIDKDNVPLYDTTQLSREDQCSSYGRSSAADRERERARIRQSKEIDFRLAPSKEYLLGEGRHCNVFLGSYKRRSRSPARSNEADWHLCAVKRLHADRQSQLLGLDEAFALRRVGQHPGVVHLIDIKDEVLAATSPLPTPRDEDASKTDDFRPRQQTRAANAYAPSTVASSAVRTPFGDGGMTDSGSSSTRPDEPMSIGGARHERLSHQPAHSQPCNAPRVQLHVSSPEQDDVATFRVSDAISRTSVRYADPVAAVGEGLGDGRTTAGTDAPRLLILLELLPYNLNTYVKRNRQEVDISFWLRCALELAETIEHIHSKGCVHADIKPENILLDHSLRTKLCDFNSAIFPGTSSIVMADGLGLGTPAYGAPELTKRGAGHRVSYPVDIFSLGAVLYGLATGVEPMARARSAIDMLHRKERFFLTEENDRLARDALAEGWASPSNGGSAATSRQSSLKIKKTKARQSLEEHTSPRTGSMMQRPAVRRQDSGESLQSVASSITTLGGRTPNLSAIHFLLDPGSSSGLFLPFHTGQAGAELGLGTKMCPGPLRDAATTKGHHRTASLHKKSPGQDQDASSNQSQRTGPWALLRRTTSYGCEQSSQTRESEGAGEETERKEFTGAPRSERQPMESIARILDDRARQESREADSLPRVSGRHDLGLALAASFAESARQQSHTSGSLQHRVLQSQHARRASQDISPTTEGLSGEANEAVSGAVEEDRSPYDDGSPALMLPGGGRLPQEALDLLEAMLRSEPTRRPDIKAVKERLLLIRNIVRGC